MEATQAVVSPGIIDGLSRLEVLFTAILLPFLATMILGAIEGLIESLGWRQRMVKTGWDICILSAGAAGIFSSPEIVREWGFHTVSLALVSIIVSIGAAVIIMHIRKTKKDEVKAWHGVVALMLGGAALSLPVYFALHSGA